MKLPINTERVVQMNKSGLIGLSVVFAASMATSVLAEGAKAPKADKVDRQEAVFKKADVNNDGKLSLDEFKTIVKVDAVKKFAAADTDKDVFVSLAEFKAWHAAKQACKAVAKDAKAVPLVPAAPVPAKYVSWGPIMVPPTTPVAPAVPAK